MRFCRPPNPTHRLNYHALDTALHDKRKAGRGHTHLVQLQNCAQAYRRGDDVVLKLYNTEIITFHPDGSVMIDCRGWIDKVATRQWLREAGFYVFRQKIGDWDEPVYLYHQRWAGAWDGRANDGSVLYYNGIEIDKTGMVTSEVKPIVKRVPNAEAKALLKRWRKSAMEVYLPHLHMAREGHNFRVAYVRSHDAIAIIEKGEFNLDVLRAMLCYKTENPRTKLNNYLCSLWVPHVRYNQMFDEVPFTKEK